MQKNYQELEQISFPTFKGIMVNMMPIVVGDIKSLPEELKPYQHLINKTKLEQGSIAYLTVRESIITGSKTQSRAGIHVEAPKLNCWGGGNWGGRIDSKGIYMASNDGACNVWNEYIEERDQFGACSPQTKPEKMKANMLYWLTDKTPHEAIPSVDGFERQFFRLVSDEVSLWFSQHNTPNPLGILPTCEIVDYNKFH